MCRLLVWKNSPISIQGSKFKTKVPLELIHSDVFGPVKEPSINRMRYMVTFIDDIFRCIWIDSMKEKKEAIIKFKEFKEKVEKTIGLNIKCL